MDIVQFKEQLNEAEGAVPGEKLLIEEVISINVPELKPYKYLVMYMQRNPPGAMPGCTTTTNGDPSLGGNVILLFGRLCHSMQHSNASKRAWTFCCRPGLFDFGYDPDRADNKPVIYVSVHGIDLDDHEAFMEEN